MPYVLIWCTYMRHYNVSSDQHEVVHSNSCPIFPACSATSRPISPCTLCADFTCSIQEEPNEVSFLHSATSTCSDLAIEEGEGQNEVRRFDSLLDLEVLFAQRLFQLSIAKQGRLCHRLWLELDSRIRLQTLLLEYQWSV